MSITWNGVSSDTIGVIVEKVPNRYVPTRRFSPQQVAGRNGNILLVDKSFPNVEQEYEVYLSAESRGIPAVARACAEWLMGPDGYCVLTDSYDTTVYREAFLMGGFDIENILNKFGKCSISFSCKPQKYLITDETLVAHNPEIYSGAIANFTATADDEITSLTSSITPVQSFNGYDHPWPAGGGVNLLPSGGAFDVTASGIRFVSDGNGTYTINGTATANAVYDFDIQEITLPSNVYLHMLNNSSTYNVAFVFLYGTTQIVAPTPVPVNAIKDLSAPLGGRTVNKLRLYVANGYTANMTFSPMLCIDDTVKPFSPYSNICPITGWTGANAYVSPIQDVADATTYPVTWQTEAGTVYCGTVDVVSGVLKVKPYIASYNGETLVGPWVSSMDAYTQGGTPTTGAQVVDLGGTETEYTLTGQTASPIVGNNYVWADTGDVSVAVYGHITASTTNPTPFDARPIITVSGAGTVTINGYEIEILESVSDFTINCETMEADDNKKISCLEFPVLSGGSNTVTCDAGITSISMVPRWWTL